MCKFFVGDKSTQVKLNLNNRRLLTTFVFINFLLPLKQPNTVWYTCLFLSMSLKFQLESIIMSLIDSLSHKKSNNEAAMVA